MELPQFDLPLPRLPGRRLRYPKLTAIALLACGAMSNVKAVEVLNMVESPSGSGLYTDLITASFPGIGVTEDWSFEAEAGDRLSVRLEADVGISRPKIRLLNAGGSAIASVNGGTDGVAVIQNYAFSSAGVYRLRLYSDHAASDFEARVTLSKGVGLEEESNDDVLTVGRIATLVGAQELSFAIAGLLPEADPADVYGLGIIPAGAELTVDLQNDGSSLTAADVLWQVLERRLADGSLDFGNSHFVTVEHDAAFDAIETAGVLTISAWINIDAYSSGWFPIFDKYEASGDTGWEFMVRGNEEGLQFYSTSGAGAISNVEIPTDVWTHVAVTYNHGGNEVRFYINGAPVATVPSPGPLHDTDGEVAYIGHSPTGGNEYANGEIAELAIWDRVLSPAEVAEQALGYPSIGGSAGRVALWLFDEGSGTAAFDSSGAGLTALLGGGDPVEEPTWSTGAVRPAAASTNGLALAHLFEGTADAWVRLEATGNKGLSARYLIEGEVTDDFGFSVVSVTLPPPGSPVSNFIQNFTVVVDEELDPDSANTIANYTLKSVPPGGTFGVSPETVYPLELATYSTGTTLSFGLVAGPLQPGIHRFTIGLGLTDKFGNPITSEYNHTFTVEQFGDFVIETLGNDDKTGASTLSPTGVGSEFDGSWSFETPVTPGGNSPYGLATGDLNSDGHADVVTANFSGNNIGVLLGLGDGTFEEVATYEAPNNPTKVVLADLNGDSRPDVAATRYNGSAVRIWMTLPDGTLDTPVDITTGTNPAWLTSADLDGDTFADLVVPNYGANTVTILYGNGDGSFDSNIDVPVSGSPYGSALGDMNNDGRMDIVVGCFNGQTVRVLYREAGGDYTVGDPLDWTGTNIIAVAAGDIDGDGRDDIVAVSNSGSEARLWLQQGDGTMGEGAAIPLGSSTNNFSVRLYDFDEDSDLDLLIGRYYYLATIENLGGGQFGQALFNHTYQNTRDAVAEDFNEDGIIDLIATAEGNHVLRLFLGRGVQELTADGVDGSRIGYARGSIYSSSDVDYFSFSANAGERVFIGSETPDNASNSSLHYRVYLPDEPDDSPILTFNGNSSGNSGTGQTQFIAPVSGTYFIRVSQSNAYRGEYRLMVTTIPGDAQLESENNHTTGSADVLALAEQTGARSASVLGFLRHADPGDLYALGFLAGGTVVTMDATKPPSSGLVWVLEILNSGGAAVASSAPGAASLSYPIPNEADGFYYARMTPSSGNDLNGQYRLDLTLADVVAPTITQNTLPAEGSTVSQPVDRFTLGFSEHLLASSVNNTGSYELVEINSSDTYTVVLESAYTSGLTQNYLVTDGPLQPGDYRFRAYQTLQDLYLNPLDAVHERTFSVEGVPGFIFESRDNDSRDTATTLSPTGVSAEFDGSWAFQLPIESGDGPEGLATADLDGDGHLDVLTTNWVGGSLTVLMGNGDGTYDPAVAYDAPNDPFSVVTADFDEDGWPDVAATRYNGDGVRIWVNQQNGTLGEPTDRPTGTDANWLTTGDINGDDNIDIVVANYGADTVSILHGNGDGTFQGNVDVAAGDGPYGVAVRDVNNDGRIDIVAGNYNAQGVRVLYRGVDGTYGSEIFLPWSGENVRSVAVGDLDGEGLPDIAAVSNSDGEARLWLQQPDGSMGEPMSIVLGSSTNNYSVRLYDFDGDSDLDVLVGRHNYAVAIENQGGAQFGAPQSLYTGSSTLDATAGDFNEDGRIDILGLAENNDHLSLFLGQGAQLLAEDGEDGSRTGYGRGNNYSSSDVDFFTFSAMAGDRVFVGSETPGNPSSSGLHYRIYRPDEINDSPIASFSAGSDGTGQTQFVAPVSGTYYLRVSSNYSYRGEYRFMVTTIPSDLEIETESNNSTGSADTFVFEQGAGTRSSAVIGFLRHGDTSDNFALGFLVEGTEITLEAIKPPSSNLVWILEVLKGNSVVATGAAGGPELVYVVPAAADDFYYARISPSSGNDLNGQYRLAMAVADTVAPTIISNTLPAEGSTVSEPIDRFALGFSEHLLAATVNSTANYDLVELGSGDVYTVALDGAYTSGLSQSYLVTDGPLQPGEYRFRALEGLQDLYANPLAEVHERNFTVVGVPPFIYESRDNDTRDMAVSLSPTGVSPEFDGSWDFGTTFSPGGNNPRGIAAADMNGDGHLDVVSANWSAGNIGVLIGNGEGTFGEVVTYPAPNNPFRVVLADFNGDTRPDVAATRYSGDGVRIWMTLEDGVLAEPVDRSTGVDAAWLASADLNDDSYEDIVVANYSGGTVSILYGNGDGSFQPNQDVAVASPYGIATGDLNDDSRVDIVIGSYAEQGIRILYGQPDNSYMVGELLAWPGENVVSIAVGDFDGDGRDDVVAVPNSAPDARFWLQQSDGTMGDSTDVPIGSSTNNYSVRLHDIGEDGDNDLLIGRHNNVVMVENQGAAVFGNAAMPEAFGSVYDVIAGDFNEDGRIDLLGAVENNHLLRLFLGRGTQLLTPDGADGSRIGYGRGNIHTSADNDFFSFSANAGDRVIIGSETPGNPSSSGLHYRIFRPEETGNSALTSFSAGSDGTGQMQFIAPVSGTYYLRVSYNYSYNGEYRFMVTTIPGDAELESEANSSTGSADSLTFVQDVGTRTASVYGFLRYGDSADYYTLGFLAGGLVLTMEAEKPPSSGLVWILEILNSSGSIVASEAAGETVLNHVLPGDAADTYFARIRPSSGNDLNGQYRLTLTVADTVPPSITGDTLPTEGSTIMTIMDRFGLSFSEEMLPSAVNDPATFELRGAGDDATFDTSDDAVIPLALSTSYNGGLDITLVSTGGLLQADSYRFTVFPSLVDNALNALPEPYVRTFTVGQIAGYIFEEEPNGSLETGTGLLLGSEQPGYWTAAGRGFLVDNSDNDYWSFDALAGDQVIIYGETPFDNSGAGLRYRLTDPLGVELYDQSIGSSGSFSTPTLTLNENGTYAFRVTINYGFHGEYRFRVILVRDGLELELEPNGSTLTATPITLVADVDRLTGTVAGLVQPSSELDYFALGMIEAGTTVFLSTRVPDGSTFAPLVSVYNSTGALMSETGGGRPDDGVAQVAISTSGNYYALVRTAGDTGGIHADYILDVLVVPTEDISFPNLQPTILTSLPATGLSSGDVSSIEFRVDNVGNLTTPAVTWNDRVVLSTDLIYGNEDDLEIGLFLHTGPLVEGAHYIVNEAVTIPDGISGDFNVIVRTDQTNVVNEYVVEADNEIAGGELIQITLADYPDLQIEDLQISEPDGGGLRTASWLLANRGDGTAELPFAERVTVRNAFSGVIAVQELRQVNSSIDADQTLARSIDFTVATAGTWIVEIVADASADLYEFNASGHTAAETNNGKNDSFQIVQFFTLTLSAAPSEAGSVAGAGSYAEGSSRNVVATPNAPYIFTGWFEGGFLRSNNASYTFALNSNRSLTARFALPSYFIATPVSPAGKGIVTGGGAHALNSTVMLQASPQPGYNFLNWTEGGTPIGDSPTLSFTVTGSRTITANFTEANPSHNVTTGTQPEGIAVVTGAGVVGNGIPVNFVAPATVVDGDIEYVFARFRLNGNPTSSSPSWTRTFSTLDPQNIAIVAEYTERSLKPVVTQVTANFGNPAPMTDNFRLTLRFDRPMDTGVNPTVALQSGNAAATPSVAASGAWANSTTFNVAPITFGSDNGGDYNVIASDARDTDNRIMDEAAVHAFSVDVEAPPLPTLAQESVTNSTARVGWPGYAAPGDLKWYRVYRSATTFSSTTGLSPITTLSKLATTYTFGGLSPDTDYFVAIVPIDVSGNALTTVPAFTVRIESTIPPLVNFDVDASATDAASITWTYNTSGLIGFQGFHIYRSGEPFTSVDGMTPFDSVGAGVRSYADTGLDRTQDYHYAVVGYNRLDESLIEVESQPWVDPLSGTISTNFTVNETSVNILEPITVSGGATFTVPAGVTIHFAPGAGLVIEDGRLVVNGTVFEPVIFTSEDDVPGGSPQPGDWAGVVLSDNTTASQLRNLILRYGGGLEISGAPASGHVIETLASVWNSGPGLRLVDSEQIITGAYLVNNEVGAVTEGTAALTLTDSVLNNLNANAANDGGSFDATGNWWGTANAASIAAKISGVVTTAEYLTAEPVLNVGMRTASGANSTSATPLPLHIASLNATSFRISEDSAFIGELFLDLPKDDQSPVLYNDAPFEVLQSLSAGAGLKTIYIQFRTATGGLSEPQTIEVEYITDAPSITGFSLMEGQTVTRPLQVTGSATSALGLQSLKFFVDDVEVASSATSPLQLLWDMRTLSSGVHRVRLEARDISGSLASHSVNVVIDPAVGPQPVIISPESEVLTTTPIITVTGTAEPLAEIRIRRNGAVMATVQADASGNFTAPDIGLVEGVNEIAASAFDIIGSASSAPVFIDLDSGAPSAVTLLPPEYQPDEGIFLDWDLPASGEVPISYRVFWHSSSFTDPADATGQSELTLRSSAYLGTEVADGMTYFAVVGYDAAGNVSALSNLQSLNVDQTLPSFTVAYSKASPVGPGPLTITLTASEPLAGVPLLLLKGAGNSLVSVTLSEAGGNSYTATFPVTTLSAQSGAAQLIVNAVDLAENRFTGPPASGPDLVFDLTKPTGTIETDLPPPVQTLFGDVTVGITLSLSEVPEADTPPSLDFAIPNGGGTVNVPLSGAGTDWSGNLTLTSGMGSGEGIFLLNVTDTVGNDGTVITEGEKLEIYNDDAPSAPAIPGNFTLTPMAGGAMRLQWNASDNALSYRVYREAGSGAEVPTTIIAQDILATTYTDIPPEDGVYRYVVRAFRLGAESGASGIRAGPSDRTPPPAPVDTSATLGVNGINIEWTPNEGETPARWIVYRNGSPIRTISSVLTTFRDSPPRGLMTYAVAAADSLGNEAQGPDASIELLVGAVSSIAATVDPENGTDLDWTSSDPTAVGFNVYRDGILQNASPIGASEFSDTFNSSQQTTEYAVTAVNVDADESAPRTILVQPVTATLEINPTPAGQQRSVSHYFDNYRLGVTVGSNATGPLMLDDGEIVRVVSGDEPLVELFQLPQSVLSGATHSTDIAIPAPIVPGVAQAVSITLRGMPDSGGSTVDYRFIADLPSGDAPSLMMTVSAANAPLAGGLTDFNVRVFNMGYMPADLVLSRGNNSSPGDLRLEVVTAEGVVAASTAYEGSPPGLIINGHGDAFLRVDPGAFVEIAFPDVFVPEALVDEDSVSFRAVFEAIYHGTGSSDERIAGPLVGTMESSLSATPYYGTAMTSQPFYSDNQPVEISGQALDRDTGEPVPNVPLVISVRVQGAVLPHVVTTDETGAYTFDYTPPFGIAGQLVIWAAHPDIVDQLHQVEVSFYRMLVSPGRGEIVMSKNDTIDFELTLLNQGNVELSDLGMSFRAWVMDGENEISIDSITASLAESLPNAVEGKSTSALRLRLEADLDAPDDAAVEFSFTTAEGATATFTGSVALRPAVAVLTTVSPTKGYAEAGLARGDLKSVEVTVQNRGLRDLTGVKMTPPALFPWMQVSMPVGTDGLISMPDIPVGGSRTFTVVFAPPENAEIGYYNDFLKISGENSQGDYQLNLFATVLGSSGDGGGGGGDEESDLLTGSVLFTVLNSLGDPVPNTSIWLRSAVFGNQIGPVLTDAVGQVLVEDLSEGNWHWKTDAPGHAAKAGVVEVIPEQVVDVAAEVLLNLVTVKFSVVPVAFTDYYEIKIEQTFQTRTPIPNLILSPPHQSLSVEPGWTGTLIYKLRNEGLRSAFDVVVREMSLPTMRITPLVTYIPELYAQEEVEIPVYFEYFGTEGADVDPARSSTNQLSQLISFGGGEVPASSPLKAGTISDAIDTGKSIYDCYKEIKYGTITLQTAAYIDCASGERYNVGVNATIDVDELLALVCDGECPEHWTEGAGILSGELKKQCDKIVGKVLEKVSKKTKVIDIICKASNIMKAVGCAAIHLPPANGRIGGFGLLDGIGGGGGGGGGGFQRATSSPSRSGGGFSGWKVESSACFTAGTPITLGDGTTRMVEDLINGIELLSSPEGHTSKLGQLRMLRSDHVREVTFRKRGTGEHRTLRLTHDHRIWIDGAGWMFAGSVLPGAWLHGDDGEYYEVLSNKRLPGTHLVYALHLIGDRALFAGGVLVEDQCFQEPIEETVAEEGGVK